MCRHVQFQERAGTGVTEAFGLVEREAELTVKRASRLQRQRFGQIPEQLMELPHDREHLEHLPGEAWAPVPVPSSEGHLSDFLPCAEAVIHGAARKTVLPEAVVDAAAEVRLQIGTGRAGGLRIRSLREMPAARQFRIEM